MNKKCKQCLKYKDIYDFARTRDSYGKVKYLTLCRACKSANVSKSRKASKHIEIITNQDTVEYAKDAFVDDPRAINEILVGKVVRQPTYVPGGSND